MEVFVKKLFTVKVVKAITIILTYPMGANIIDYRLGVVSIYLFLYNLGNW